MSSLGKRKADEDAVRYNETGKAIFVRDGKGELVTVFSFSRPLWAAEVAPFPQHNILFAHYRPAHKAKLRHLRRWEPVFAVQVGSNRLQLLLRKISARLTHHFMFWLEWGRQLRRIARATANGTHTTSPHGGQHGASRVACP